METVEGEEHEDELDHRRRRPREQHAREKARETRDLKKASVARLRLGDDLGYRATLPNQKERSPRHTRATGSVRPRFPARSLPDRRSGGPIADRHPGPSSEAPHPCRYPARAFVVAAAD